jgi:hypothetical protein
LTAFVVHTTPPPHAPPARLTAIAVGHCVVVGPPPWQDNFKFNRGKLLNIGALFAIEDGFDALCFHDVDLIPDVSPARRGPLLCQAHVGPCACVMRGGRLWTTCCGCCCCWCGEAAGQAGAVLHHGADYTRTSCKGTCGAVHEVAGFAVL